ncbi:MAG: GNAT family N-acetyltransferase [Coprobacillaceae bacterium]
MLIREINIEDTKRIQEINKMALSYDYPFEQTKDKISKILNLEGSKILVACTKNEVVGYIHMSDYECTYMDSLKNILALAVDPTYQKQGIGKLLIQATEEWAKEDGSTGIRLVSGHNREEAHKFYQRCGYHMRKEQKNFIKFF